MQFSLIFLQLFMILKDCCFQEQQLLQKVELNYKLIFFEVDFPSLLDFENIVI